MAKKYYWLRLKDDWFNSKVIKKLRKIAGGDTYTIIYLKMQLLSLKNEGKLYYEGVEDSFEEELALDLDEDIDNVTVTVSYLQKCGLLEVISKDQYLLTEVPAVTGSESASAERVRKHRAQKELFEQMSETKALQCNTGVTEGNAEVTNCNTEKEIEKEIEKDKEKDNKNISLELKDSKQNTFISLPLVTGSGNYDVTFDYLNSLRELFPALDVEQEFRSMAAWLDSHPRNRKTPRGIKRFITGWLERSQNSMPASRTPQAPAATKNMSTDQYMEATSGWCEGMGD